MRETTESWMSEKKISAIFTFPHKLKGKVLKCHEKNAND